MLNLFDLATSSSITSQKKTIINKFQSQIKSKTNHKTSKAFKTHHLIQQSQYNSTPQKKKKFIRIKTQLTIQFIISTTIQEIQYKIKIFKIIIKRSKTRFTI